MLTAAPTARLAVLTRFAAFTLAAASAACGTPTDECAAGCPACTVCYYGSCRADPSCGDADGSGDSDARTDADGPTETDGRPDAEAYDDAPVDRPDAEVPEVETLDDAPLDEEAEVDDAGADEADVPPPCAGASVGGFCWYASAVAQSCTDACNFHGGCVLAGTRDFAGSGGTDANCVAVLAALGYGGYPHQDFSNNDQGCHYAWDSWTYWSTAFPTTCETFAVGAANVVRMCACTE
jgi:hypothetical protein